MAGKKLKQNGRNSFIVSTFVTLLIILLLIFSGPIAGALKVTLSANKQTVQAGASGDAGNITFTTWVNLSSPDAYVPIQRIYLNLSGPQDRSFSFNPSGGDIKGYRPGYPDEITVVASPAGGFGSGNYGIGYGYGYGYNTGSYYDFGYGYGYAGQYGAGTIPLNISYTITLNTSNLYDGNYTATTNVYAAGDISHSFTSTSTAFEVLPRIFEEPIPQIPANNHSTPRDVSTPVGNLSYTIVAGPNATKPVNLTVTVQVSPPSKAGGKHVNSSTGSGGLGAGAIPNLYFNYSIDDPEWYDNISYIHIRMYYNEADLPSGVDESTLLPARYIQNASAPTGTGWLKLTCPTCPKLLEVDPDDGRNVYLYASGVNTAENYVWANVTHYSTFAIAGTIAATPSTGSSSGDSSGGGGGGGVSTSEPFENIEDAQRQEKSLKVGEPVSYIFTAPELGIHEIVVTGEANEYDIAIRVELLKGTSQLVSASAPGIVYKNLNIWAGTKRIKEALIRFKVENSWLENNDVESGDVRIVRWDGSKWLQLSTTENTKDATYTYFETNTYGFSSFAIIGLKDSESVPIEPIPDDVTSGADDVTSAEGDSSGLSVTELLAGALGLYLPTGKGETISIIVLTGLIIIVVALRVMKRRM